MNTKGTSYTIMNVEAATKTTTATNYVEYSGACVGLSPHELGPCLHRSKHQVPESYILTKTHCTAYCMDCPPKMYRIPSAQEFEKECRSGSIRNTTDHSEHMEYPRTRVKKAIHLIRDPFDNLIGRLHLSVKRKRRQGKSEDEIKDNLSDWCQYLDSKAQKEERSSGLFPPGYIDNFQHVPCHVEWFRYIQWHNLAFQSTRMKPFEIPVHYLYYDDYANDYNATVAAVLDFLELEEYNTGKVKDFVPGKSYRQLFTVEHQIQAKAMAKVLAMPAVWDLIRHYFDGIPDLDRNDHPLALDASGREWHEVLWGNSERKDD